jgi:hypothetical protein
VFFFFFQETSHIHICIKEHGARIQRSIHNFRDWCCYLQVVWVISPLLKKEVWDGALSWCNSQFFCLQKFGAKSSHICTQSLQNVTVVCRTDCLACQDEFFVNNPLDVKGPLSVHLSNHWQSLHSTIYGICIEFDAHLRSNPLRNRIRPSTRLQIKGRKKSERLPRWVKWCTLTPKIW